MRSRLTGAETLVAEHPCAVDMPSRRAGRLLSRWPPCRDHGSPWVVRQRLFDFGRVVGQVRAACRRHTGHPGPRALDGLDLFGFSGAVAPENPNKSQALARIPGIPGIRFGLNDGTNRQSVDYATGEVRGFGKVNLFADTPYLVLTTRDHENRRSITPQNGSGDRSTGRSTWVRSQDSRDWPYGQRRREQFADR
jgi:hypothetical protein